MGIHQRIERLEKDASAADGFCRCDESLITNRPREEWPELLETGPRVCDHCGKQIDSNVRLETRVIRPMEGA